MKTEKSSSVVFWTSEWVETGETEIRNYSNNIKKEVSRKILKGKVNTEYTRLKINQGDGNG